MRISRKSFVSAGAIGLGAAVLPATSNAQSNPPATLHFHVLEPSEFDRAGMMRILETPKRNKQVFQSVSPLTVGGVASVYLHMQNSMNAFEFSLGQGPGSLATLAVMTGPSIVFALPDSLWERYKFGDAFKLAPANVYYTARSLRRAASPDDPDGIYQDWSAQAVLHRGGAFMVCHNAMTAVAGLIAQGAGLQPRDVLADFEHNVLPGFHVVPAGVAATQLAIQHGWSPYTII